MSKPIFHAMSSAKKFGGEPEEYLDLHQFLDSSKGTFPDNRHRCLTHNAWFLSNVVERVYGVSFVNSVGRIVSWREVAEQHVLEDFNGRYIPTAQDFLENMEFKEWMDNARSEPPPSHRKIQELKDRQEQNKTTRTIKFDRD